jgi:hypothetical protein
MIGYGLAIALAIAIAFMPVAARSGGYSTDPRQHSAPRWSNDRHHEEGLIVGRDCVALPPGASAQYIPGRDAWGRTVIPAEQPKGFVNSFPVEVEIDVPVGNKIIGGRRIDMTAGRFSFDPATNELSLNGRTWRQRDCHPSPK